MKHVSCQLLVLLPDRPRFGQRSRAEGMPEGSSANQVFEGGRAARRIVAMLIAR